jgi:hypothetical protein
MCASQRVFNDAKQALYVGVEGRFSEIGARASEFVRRPSEAENPHPSLDAKKEGEEKLSL